ncbi:MAG: polyprenyl synthetase family protein, partial [Deltaproteobacteria bacterium]|nr:polyprenyl synthetase family protein [Deltaproteobacteria bacterium]
MIEHICVSIQDDLRRVEEAISFHLKSDLSMLNTVTEYVTRNGGKRIRPALFLLSARLAGVTNPEVVKAAAGFELIHTASLLHDDVVDDAAVRRSKPSAKVKWGNQVSVLVGDFLWSKGCSLFVAQRSHELMNAIVEAIAGLTEGVLLEISRQNDITMDEDVYIKIIRGKTAALFAACGEGAGVLAGVSEPFVMALKRYGFDFGVAFQLADDALDYVSDEARFGKTTGTDLREGKLTFPLIAVLKHATPEETRLIRDVLISDHLTDAQFHDVLN